MEDYGLNFFELLPDPVEISDCVLDECRQSGDFRQILFEYYKNVSMLCCICSQIIPESPGWLTSTDKKRYVLLGLLTRCTRILAAHLEFFQDGRYGDVTTILDRPLLETCVKVRWISQDRGEQRLQRYFEDSLKSDLELLDKIKSNIKARGGLELPIEKRMLHSIRKNAEFAGIGIDDKEINLKRAPSLADMVRDIGEDRFMYTIVGKISSHAVHGSLANLLYLYLDADQKIDGRFIPAVEFPAAHVNQYVFNCLFVLDACLDFVSFNFEDGDEMDYFSAVLTTYSSEILELYREIVGGDFDPPAS
ncbi:DUF5677 domain-containing protein [Marinovum sp.]|uniref:DUF5677 domain-containing protein n=1 Tax=Marinovum sp. TaxID=2024839 RepID=UPI003A8E5EB7